MIGLNLTDKFIFKNVVQFFTANLIHYGSINDTTTLTWQSPCDDYSVL